MVGIVRDNVEKYTALNSGLNKVILLLFYNMLFELQNNVCNISNPVKLW